MLIREKDKQALHSIFSSVGCPLEVWAYGSRVNGTAHDASDLDLVIRQNGIPLISATTFMELTETIQESNIPILVDLKDWNRIPEYFYANIEQQYEVFFDNRALFSSLD